MSAVDRRRRLIEALKSIRPEVRTAITSDDSSLLAYYGWGIMLNSAQEEAVRDIKAFPPGTVHVWRFANRTGKTTGLSYFHTECVWTKWRYVNPDQERWLAYDYRTLHAAPLNVLAGKAWSMIESWTVGAADEQWDPINLRQRSGFFVNSGLFVPRQGKRVDGSDALWVECVTGGTIDMASTHAGGARVEGSGWWFLSWDEFPRQVPTESIPDMIDQTFIPRSSDHEAPVALSGTAILEADAVYDEIEEKAKGSRWYNFKSFARSANFSQTARSIDRQREASFDKAAVHRSVEGGIGEGGHGAMYPIFVVRNAFHDVEDPVMEHERTVADLPPLPKGRRWMPLMSVDHAIAKDRTVALVVAAPWPPFDPNSPAERPLLYRHRIEGLALAVQRSGSSMTPDQQERFVDRVYQRYDPLVEIVDATGEGGQMLYRSLRAKKHRVRPCNYTERLPSQKVSNKDYGRSALAKMLGYGLVDEFGDDDDLLASLEEPAPGTPYGLFSFPRAGGGFLRLERQLKTLKVDDEKQQQDEAMALVQIAWHLWPFYARGRRATVSGADIRAPRGSRRLMTTRAR